MPREPAGHLLHRRRPGRRLGPSPGLELLGARNYDPTQGRFLTPDPIFEPDNPASGSDPSGLKLSSNDGSNGTQCHWSCTKKKKGDNIKTSSGSGGSGGSPAPSTPAPPMGPTPASTQTPTPTLGETPRQPEDFGTNRCQSYDGGQIIYMAIGIVARPPAAMCIATLLESGGSGSLGSCKEVK
ncbi:hypothetical protein [Streptomyces sp. RB17]|uniref:hypothetical protein n=1 Tax=Streptomyces sp. RB17 TaxID=2585197 RepID=UPI00129761A2|nr:hypothetical protein [Streptomyces sp. RB17]